MEQFEFKDIVTANAKIRSLNSEVNRLREALRASGRVNAALLKELDETLEVFESRFLTEGEENAGRPKRGRPSKADLARRANEQAAPA